VVGFGTSEKQILIEPVFAQFVQGAHGKVLYGFNTLLSNLDSIEPYWRCLLLSSNWIDAINNGTNSLFLTIGLAISWYTTRSRWVYIPLF